MEKKACSNSLAVKTSHVLPPDTNSFGTLFGGKLMAHIDDVAAISASRHARKPVVTASTDSVDFLAPVKEGHSICVEAFVTWTHHTSMEVFVKAVTEDLLTGERSVCTTAFLTFVAIDENGKPTPVPGVIPESEHEKKLHHLAADRAEQRKQRREQSKEFAHIFGTDYPWNRG
ncbi:MULTISPECIES: acyl-CoA thioesterase [Virgibacillus]|uniref:Acyl-CoA thioester hydrolase YkhA n=2 Tax=Virgibacillus TaxID=84406 RepID=A0ABQ2DDZ7_9BACI|nr:MULTISPECIES: acyl-CoA thioesterase [Virgibacillus]EQB38271.1 acyl-CoA hydrolase [Virgibacillus sp. CM-4]MYL40976.1 acyl-CoA thioesterase [Virgibacillus massiliensis]GGJ53278.1 putative acyl-CoA thioester hydrolase YkhA [Virgibacillus kapii]CDQ38225.1 putative acyl-CoA thioester hydrolase [Virgibacillus massiliensis]